jgi:hypothetical protein
MSDVASVSVASRTRSASPTAVASSYARRAWAGTSGSPGRAEEDQDPERRDPKRVVVELIGELECFAGVLESTHEALLEAHRPGEAAVNPRLKHRLKLSFAQRLLEQCPGAVESLEVGEESKSRGAQLSLVRLR